MSVIDSSPTESSAPVAVRFGASPVPYRISTRSGSTVVCPSSAFGLSIWPVRRFGSWPPTRDRFAFHFAYFASFGSLCAGGPLGDSLGDLAGQVAAERTLHAGEREVDRVDQMFYPGDVGREIVGRHGVQPCDGNESRWGGCSGSVCLAWWYSWRSG